MSRIITRDSEGRENGWLIPLWNALERPDLRPEQVYLTVVKPGMVKGPHLHRKRRGVFFCIRGAIAVMTRPVDESGRLLAGGMWNILSCPSDPHNPTPREAEADWSVHNWTEVPPGIACAIYNTGDNDAYVLNMPSPAWSKDDPDDWPVENWQHPEWWKPPRTSQVRPYRPYTPYVDYRRSLLP